MDKTTRTGEVDLFVVEDGPADGKAVLLLPGFPDSAQLWRFQIPVVAAAGYHVIAPDLRAFGRSSKPSQVDDYALPLLVADLIGLLDSLNVEQPAVVGHDWGAGIGWALAATLPDRVERLAALAVGHPSGYFSGGIEQLEKSWYMLWFLPPGIAEAGLAGDNWSFLRRLTRYAVDIESGVIDGGEVVGVEVADDNRSLVGLVVDEPQFGQDGHGRPQVVGTNTECREMTVFLHLRNDDGEARMCRLKV